MPSAQTTLMIVSSRSRAQMLTTPTSRADATAPTTAPSVAEHQPQRQTRCRKSATPTPPSAACALAPAIDEIRRVTTIVPITPSAMLDRAPISRA